MTSEHLVWAIDWIMDPTLNPYYSHRPAVVTLTTAFTTCEPMALYLERAISKLVGHPYDASGGCRLPQPGEWEGIPVVVSANNFGTDQVFTTPARMAYANTSFATCGRVISVGATNSSDQRWMCENEPGGAAANCIPIYAGACGNTDTPGSNYGPNVDIYAPGTNITPARQYDPQAYSFGPAFYRAGTSYAAPIVAGVIARMASVEGSMTCDWAWRRLQETASYVITWDARPVDANGNLPMPAEKPLVNRR